MLSFSMTISILITCTLVFLATLVVHEAGHAAAGVSVGYQCTEISVGLGPRIWAATRCGVTFSLRLFAFAGAYCRLNVSEGRVPKTRERIYVALAGPLANIAIAFIAGYLVLGIGHTLDVIGQMGYAVGSLLLHPLHMVTVAIPQVGIVFDHMSIADRIAELFIFVNLLVAITNLMPFPCVDGGNVVFAIVRRIVGPAFAPVEGHLRFAGITIVATLTVGQILFGLVKLGILTN